MASRYEVLAQLIDNGEIGNDQSGNYNVIIAVLGILHNADDSKLSDDIYEMIADIFVSDPFKADADGS